MGKRARNRPTRVEQYVPIYIPTEDGYGELELGMASVRGNTVILEFNTKLPSVAIKNRIERGEIVGVTFVIPEDEAAEARRMEAAREAEAKEEQKNETPEEKAIREADEARAAEIDNILLNTELERLEEEENG